MEKGVSRAVVGNIELAIELFIGEVLAEKEQLACSPRIMSE
jgi:hypothetical protein